MAMYLKEGLIDNLTNSMDILKKLFEGEQKRLDRFLDEIILANDRLNNRPRSVGFLYNGDFYKKSGSISPMHGERVPLHFDLFNQMREYLVDSSKVVADINKINQMVHRILKGCTTEQDLRDVLPECLVNLSTELPKLKRCRQEAFTLIGDIRAQKQYALIKPLIEFYYASRMMY